jgi:hypothetical protein
MAWKLDTAHNDRVTANEYSINNSNTREVVPSIAFPSQQKLLNAQRQNFSSD